MPDTDFGFQRVPEHDKAARVRAVFESVAGKYDLMNDLMSGGLHRAWKAFAIAQSGVQPGQTVLDVAGGTGDLARSFATRVGPRGQVWLTDINSAMLAHGRDRLIDQGMRLPVAQCDAEHLPFRADSFDLVSVAFGLRNMTHKPQALKEMRRVIKPGGRLLVLEFSKVWQPLAGVYDSFSFGILPWLGKRVAGDADSYRYLAESIRRHPDQAALKAMMLESGFDQVDYFNLSAGVVALHRGFKY